MRAGTIGVLERPTDERLESYFNDRDIPALDVQSTQESFDDRPVQSGLVAGHTDATRKHIDIGVNPDGDPVGIDVSQDEGRERVVTEWVADVTASGLVVPESVYSDDIAAFPLDVFWNVTGSQVTLPFINVESLHREWSREDVLGDVWMVGRDPGDGASMNYHAAASESATPTFGLGFERPWNGTVMRGVVYESGYVAVYNTNHDSQFIRFIDEELLPHAEEGDEGGQTQL